GAAAVVCRLDRVDAMLHAASPAALGGRATLVRLQATEALARRLMAGAPTNRQRRRVARLLARFAATVRRAERRGRILRVLAEGLRATVQEASRALAGISAR